MKPVGAHWAPPDGNRATARDGCGCAPRKSAGRNSPVQGLGSNRTSDSLLTRQLFNTDVNVR
eukprot:3064313-Alexandrium_andersonii.AAC.1